MLRPSPPPRPLAVTCLCLVTAPPQQDVGSRPSFFLSSKQSHCGDTGGARKPRPRRSLEKTEQGHSPSLEASRHGPDRDEVEDVIVCHCDI